MRLNGHWVYVYRAIDQAGPVVDAYVSQRRNAAAAEAFFTRALAETGGTPRCVTTDQAKCYPPALWAWLPGVNHRCSTYLNNRLERDYQHLTQRVRPMRGFKQLHAAAIVTRGHARIQKLRHGFSMLAAAVPGAEHDKTLSDRLHTLAHLPTDCEVDADKGYQGLAAEVPYVQVRDPISGATALVPRLTVDTPIKKPKGREVTEAQKTFNQVLSAVRMRVEHCIGWAKNWAILATRFRCDHTIYTSIMSTVCGLVNTQTQRWQTVKANCA